MRLSPLLRMRPTLLRRAGQDMPPAEGYSPVQYKRNLPAKGFRPSYYIFIMGGIMVYGFWRLGQGVHEWNELTREKMWARIHLIPLLQAEEDRDQVRRYWADQGREKDLLGSNTKVYHSDRFVRPTFSITPPPSDERGYTLPNRPKDAEAQDGKDG